MIKIEPNDPVIAVLHSPRERMWGTLQKISSAGIYVRCLDLNAFEDYVSAIIRNETFIGLSSQFFPIWRVERVTLDESSGEILSLTAQFEKRTGRSIFDF